MIDLGTGNNNKMCGLLFLPLFVCLLLTKLLNRRSNWAMDSKQEVCRVPCKLDMDKVL